MLNNEKIKIGIAPIGWTNDDMPELGRDISFEQCIKEMEMAGYEGCEVGSKFPKNPKELKEKLATNNLQVAAQWFSSFFTTQKKQKTIERFKKHLDFLKKAGAKIAVISEQGNSIQGQMKTPIFKEKPTLDENGWEKLADGLNTLGEIAIKKGMRIAYHHHMGTVVQTREEVDTLMERTNPDKVFLLADTGHMAYHGGDPLKLLEDYLPEGRIAHIHLKDIRKDVIQEVKEEGLSFLKGVLKGTFTVPGDGDINFKPILDIIGSSEYEGWLLVEAEQDPQKANPLKYAKKGRKTIKELGGI